MKANAKEPKSGKRDLLNIILETSTNLINISPEGIDEEFNNVLKAIGSYANADRSYVFLFYDDGKKMSNTHEWCAEGIEQQIKHLQGMDVGDLPWFEKRIKNLEVFHIPDVKRLPIEAEKEKEEFLNENIKSLVAVLLSVFYVLTVCFIKRHGLKTEFSCLRLLPISLQMLLQEKTCCWS